MHKRDTAAHSHNHYCHEKQYVLNILNVSL